MAPDENLSRTYSAGSPAAGVVPRNPLPVGQLVPGWTDPRSQREESGSAPLPGVAASTRRRATCSVNNGSDGRSPILNAKAKPRRVDKKGRRRKDVTFAKAYRNNTSAATELIRRAAVPHCCADSMSASLSWERVR